MQTAHGISNEAQHAMVSNKAQHAMVSMPWLDSQMLMRVLGRWTLG